MIKNSEPEENKDTQTKEEEISISTPITKIILFGALQTGKSTLFKTIKHLNCNNYTQDELLAFREIIYYNIVRSLIKLVERAMSNDDNLFLNKELITKFMNNEDEMLLLCVTKYWVDDFPEMIFKIFNEPYGSGDNNKKLEYHVVNLTDIKETEACFECILSGKGQFTSQLLFSCRMQSKLQNNVYCNMKNQNLVDLIINFQ
ncbi:hypothetical protein ABK040_002033 [Willaertia magna]